MIESRAEVIDALRRAESEGDAYWNAFPLDEFFAPIGEAWSPAENVRHLTKSIRPVATALATPRVVLRVMFGRPHRASLPFDEVRVRYEGLLADGGTAGRFAPSPQEEPDHAAWRTRIMSELHAAQAQLLAALGRWSEAQLDRYQLPHPLLGKLTVREMLLFTAYHQSHHIAVVERRKAAMAS